MALVLDYNQESSGMTYPNAYFRVVQFENRILEKVVMIHCFMYKDAEARENGKEPIAINRNLGFRVDGSLYDQFFPPSYALGDNEIKRSYHALKTFDLFADAEDA